MSGRWPATGQRVTSLCFEVGSTLAFRGRLEVRDLFLVFQARVGPDHTLSRNGPLLESEHGLWHLK